LGAAPPRKDMRVEKRHDNGMEDQGQVRRSADRKPGEALGGAGARQEGENVGARFYPHAYAFMLVCWLVLKAYLIGIPLHL